MQDYNNNILEQQNIYNKNNLLVGGGSISFVE